MNGPKILKAAASSADKPLSELTDSERAALFPVVLKEYNPAYPQWFAEEKANLEEFIGTENILRINHYGSTAVPGLLSKPTVDILLEIKPNTDIERLIAALPRGYFSLRPPALTTDEPPPNLVILKGYTACGFAERVYHIHVRYAGDWDELKFRDYLIAHPKTASEYAALKVSLLGRFEYSRDEYTAAKGRFIRNVTEKAKKEAELTHENRLKSIVKGHSLL